MNRFTKIFVATVAAFTCTHTFAATPVDLKHLPITALHSFASPMVQFKKIRSSVDFNQVQHDRIQQLYMGYRVWGADAVLHITNAKKRDDKDTMNGIIFDGLKEDLVNAPEFVFSKANAERAIQTAIQLYQKKSGVRKGISTKKQELVVYTDELNKAHWAYLVRLNVTPAKGLPVQPSYLLDAIKFTVYQEWDNIKTAETKVSGGGNGGNRKMKEVSYDGLPNDLAMLDMTRDDEKEKCYLRNDDVTVKDLSRQSKIESFDCKETDGTHNNIYWDGELDPVNGAYAPGNDALFAGKVVKEMYRKWYDLPVLVKDGKPMMLEMVVHADMENAYWDGERMTFGDGGNTFYPLVSIGVGAHEISHGFTEQHSDLEYYGQSGGLNEAFSDMAAQAGEFYATGKNSWQIGPEIFKAKDEALRYMDKPSKDCYGHEPGNWCSIDNVSQYHSGLDVHYSSGIFNRIFYLMGTAEGWDTKKAFDVMVKANQDYWTSTSSFVEAACGVLKATKDYKYDLAAVEKAITKVGINTKKC